MAISGSFILIQAASIFVIAFSVWSWRKITIMRRAPGTYKNITLDSRTKDLVFKRRISSRENMKNLLDGCKKIKTENGKFMLYLSPRAAVVEIKEHGGHIYVEVRFEHDVNMEKVIVGSSIINELIEKEALLAIQDEKQGEGQSVRDRFVHLFS